MMHSFFEKASVRSFSTAALLSLFAITLHAQATPDGGVGIASGSVDVAGTFGYSNLPGADNKNHVNFGVSAGVNLSPNVAIVGEYSYMPMGALTGVNFNTQLFGAAARFSFASAKRIVPYVVVGGGGDRLTGSESGVAVTASGSYVTVGGGVNLFLGGGGFGIRPEYRWTRQEVTFAGVISDTNVEGGTVSIFYQFGKRAKKK